MYRFEITNLPNSQSQVSFLIANGNAATETAARRRLLHALVRHGISATNASMVANTAEFAWTDFPEFGITVRIDQV